nr:MAG TPA: endonuclease [Caudoviricetes sp.]
MNLIRCSYKYRMYPNKTQEELLAKTFGCVRVIWNACVDSFNSYDKETNPNPKLPTKSDLVIEKPWLNEVSAATFRTSPSIHNRICLFVNFFQAFISSG